ncbi:hypothetical protein TRAPUB_12577 [Trametes pubescens]|uniref:Uncharacterized protein n=1 Tax=Trametes pubescens TaxID=154538 RepID=A0A1M2VTF7_TRAPU|nr:hypothetical protein TRAPUB_12577 [Trametes pubescens]
MPPPDPPLVCQVIPDGREWPCTRRENVSGQGEPILCTMCTKLHNQYRKLTSKYQEHQQKAETAYPEVLGLLDHTERLKPLPTLHSVKEAFKVTDRCFSALREEISGREALQKRFFREVVEMLEARKRELMESTVVGRNHWQWHRADGQDIICMGALKAIWRRAWLATAPPAILGAIVSTSLSFE